MKKAKTILALLIAAVMSLSIIPIGSIAKEIDAASTAVKFTADAEYDNDLPFKGDYSSTTLAAMTARAEALVNYTWTPTNDIKTWNGSKYNGLTYFPQGSTVRGVPYTLFTSEVVSWSLCSLEQYQAVASSNYSATAYCVSVNATRTGPVYGSCCADLVCEVFGGNYMNGSNPRYHNVSDIRDSSYGTSYYGQKMSDVRAGDALSDYPNHGHIIWVGNVTDTQITIYEQTPPVARKVTLNKSNYTDSNGYFIYGGRQYSVITRSNAFDGTNTNTLNISATISKHSVDVNWSNVNASSYYLYVYNLETGEVPFGQNLGNSFSCHLLLDAARWRVFVTAVYSEDNMHSEFIDVTINDDLNISVDVAKHSVDVHWSSVNASSYYLYIYNLDTGDVPYGENLGNSFSCHLHLGVARWRIYVTAVYSEDDMHTEFVDVTINDDLNVCVDVSKNNVDVSWSNVNASSYYLYVYNLDTGDIPYGENLGNTFNCHLYLGEARWRIYVTAVFSEDDMHSEFADATVRDYHTITYYLDNALYDVQSVLFDDLINPPSINLDGYEFSGWTLENGDPLPVKMPCYDLSVYGSLIPISVCTPGDLDGDGIVTFIDVSALYLFLMGEGDIPAEFIANADYNGDGETSYADISDMCIALIN